MIKLEASFDDGSIYDLRTADMMYRHNIDTTFYIPVRWKEYLVSKGIEPLSDSSLGDIAGQFEIGSHGYNHELLTRIDETHQREEVFESKAYWDSQGISVSKFCYPRGYYTEDIKDLVKEAGYESARTTKIGELTKPSDQFETHTTVHVGLDRKEYGCSWIEYARKMIDKAIQKNQDGEDVVFHAWGHSEEINRNDQWQNLESFLKEITGALQ